MSRSDELFARAQQSIPGGVNSPVRAFRQVGGTPVFFSRGSGAYVYDADGRRYIDYVQSWGPLVLGHAHPAVVEAVKHTAESGLSFGAPTELEIRMAERVRERRIPIFLQKTARHRINIGAFRTSLDRLLGNALRS